MTEVEEENWLKLLFLIQVILRFIENKHFKRL